MNYTKGRLRIFYDIHLPSPIPTLITPSHHFPSLSPPYSPLLARFFFSQMNTNTHKILISHLVHFLTFSHPRVSILRHPRKRQQRTRQRPRQGLRDSCTATFGDLSKRPTMSRCPFVRNLSSSSQLNSDSTPLQRRLVAGAISSDMVEASSPMAPVWAPTWDRMDAMVSLILPVVVVW